MEWIKSVRPEIIPPSLNDNTADMDRVVKGIKKCLNTDLISFTLQHVKRISRILTLADYQVGVMVYHDGNSWQLIDVFDAAKEKRRYVVAMDLGSTTVVIRLLELETHKIISENSFFNPQIKIGSDILTRIHFAAGKGGLAELQKVIVDRINQAIKKIAATHEIDMSAIVGMAVAGNTTMTHLFLGLDPFSICREPYIPVINNFNMIKPSEIGLNINEGAPIFVFPNVGSYFGGDLIAGILSSGMWEQEEISFLVDVGTNAEVVIGNKDWLMACAGAAGPALEGGVAGMGMMAGPGVIDHVTIDPDSLEFNIRTIDGLDPVGICGSGLIDLASQLFLAGMIDLRGKFVPSRCGKQLTDNEGIPSLIVVPAAKSGIGQPLTLSQPDIDALIRSKAAMYTILTTISNSVSIPLNDISLFYVAGTFGTYIDPRSAITIGMIPDLPLERYVPLGNTSLEGASMVLFSSTHKKEVTRIRDQITYIELNVNQEFMNLFSAAKFLPHTDRSFFPTVKVTSDHL